MLKSSSSLLVADGIQSTKISYVTMWLMQRDCVQQAKVDNKIIASERIKAYRKDVLTKSGKVVGGGDQTRKMELLEKQKKGKKRMQDLGKGRVKLSQAAFNSVITRSS